MPRLPVLVRGKQKVADSSLEARYTAPIKNNAKLKACCRDVDTSDVSLYTTHDDAERPDLMVIECACGRKQYRTAVGPGRVGG